MNREITTNNTITLCLDLEFTYGKANNDKVDIYQIGIVGIDARGKEVDCFSTYVHNEFLCPTTLSFLDLSAESFVGAPTIQDALMNMNNFVSELSDKYSSIRWCSWGDRDKRIISRFAGLVSISGGHKLTRSPYFDAQESVSRKLPYIYSKRAPLSLVYEEWCNEYMSNHHDALDDARTLSKIVKRLCL